MSDTGFDETPDITSSLLADFSKDGLVNLVGGCCGTTPEHIAAIAKEVAKYQPRAWKSKWNPYKEVVNE
jgi:5-methyltetrahydrofolate--homocysteine methyltransferase